MWHNSTIWEAFHSAWKASSMKPTVIPSVGGILCLRRMCNSNPHTHTIPLDSSLLGSRNQSGSRSPVLSRNNSEMQTEGILLQMVFITSKENCFPFYGIWDIHFLKTFPQHIADYFRAGKCSLLGKGCVLWGLVLHPLPSSTYCLLGQLCSSVSKALGVYY